MSTTTKATYLKAESSNTKEHTPPNIYAIGESLIDILFSDNDSVSAKPGGSMLNACISLGRLGHQVHFLTEFGNDKAGDRIASFLNDNCVNSEYSIRHEKRKTALALAWLNKAGNASYSFYQDLPDEAPEIKLPDFKPGDIFLFGSSYSIRQRNRNNIGKLLNTAGKAGATIIYDPNIRPSKIQDTIETRNQIFEMIDKADIVKGSDEDFTYIYQNNNLLEILRHLEKQKPLFFLTSGKNGVEVIYQGVITHHTIPNIIPVSTIGAGDNFNVGIIHALISKHITKPYNQETLSAMAEDGIKLAAEVCLRTENYIARR
jgi:fructokinase